MANIINSLVSNMKMYSLLVLLYFISLSASSQDQGPQNNPVAQLAFLVGNWGGPGVSYASDGSESRYYDTEKVRFDLNKKLLLINAQGEKNGKKTYQLHTVIYYDQVVKHYWYTPYTGDRARRFACKLIAKRFLCLNNDKDFRLTFQRLTDGEWNEFGERLRDEEWTKTFETILSPL